MFDYVFIALGVLTILLDPNCPVGSEAMSIVRIPIVIRLSMVELSH